MLGSLGVEKSNLFKYIMTGYRNILKNDLEYFQTWKHVW